MMKKVRNYKEISNDELARLHRRLNERVITPPQMDRYQMGWLRVVLSSMQATMGHGQLTGIRHYSKQKEMRVSPKYKDDHHDLMMYYYEWVLVEARTGEYPESRYLYRQLRMLWWPLKGFWELQKAGVGGLDPHNKNQCSYLGRRIVDYSYWRIKAQTYYQTPHPDVRQIFDLAYGHTDYKFTVAERTTKYERLRYKDENRQYLFWSTLHDLLTPAEQLREDELTYDVLSRFK